jgi:hypothetical protein
MHARQREALYFSGLMVSADKTYSGNMETAQLCKEWEAQVRYATGQVLNCATRARDLR